MIWACDNRQSAAMIRGFTLIELLVVLVILALAMSVAAPALFTANERARLDTAASQVYDGLRRARSAAVTTGKPVSIGVGRLIKDRAITVASKTAAGPDAPVTFYPDGSATGARFALVLGAQRRSLTLDWLTGHAALGE